MTERPLSILLVEDNPADVRLTREAFRTSALQTGLSVAKDGVEAMEFLHKAGSFADARRPDLIFLDLNLPRKDGREVLAEIKGDSQLKRIPVIILTTSRAERDIIASYDLGANCYIVKPADPDQFFEVIHRTEQFWLTTVARAPL